MQPCRQGRLFPARPLGFRGGGGGWGSVRDKYTTGGGGGSGFASGPGVTGDRTTAGSGQKTAGKSDAVPGRCRRRRATRPGGAAVGRLHGGTRRGAGRGTHPRRARRLPGGTDRGCGGFRPGVGDGGPARRRQSGLRRPYAARPTADRPERCGAGDHRSTSPSTPIVVQPGFTLSPGGSPLDLAVEPCGYASAPMPPPPRPHQRGIHHRHPPHPRHAPLRCCRPASTECGEVRTMCGSGLAAPQTSGSRPTGRW
ncbi:hypothetical protein QFZ55_008155 [Streptomyces luteogriseus]|nr:hypothetical protein [Streptomyces luteogriseus]